MNQPEQQMDINKSLFPFPPEQPCPPTPQPLAWDSTADTKQSATPILDFGPWGHLPKGPRARLSLPTRSPGRKVPEGKPCEPKLTAEVSGPGFRKYGGSLAGTPGTAGLAQQPHGHSGEPGTLCWATHRSVALPPSASAAPAGEAADTPVTRRPDNVGSHEVKGSSPNVAFPLLSTGGTTRQPTIAAPFVHSPSHSSTRSGKERLQKGRASVSPLVKWGDQQHLAGWLWGSPV